MKKALWIAAAAMGVVAVLSLGAAIDRRWINRVTSKRIEQILADMQEQVDRAREINRAHAAAQFWVADGDTMFLREGELPAEPAYRRQPGRPGRVSK
jgi:hypothetical protein